MKLLHILFCRLCLAAGLGMAALGDVPVAPYDGEPVQAASGPIDEAVFGRLQKLHILPARLCSDAVFLRRVYLDVTGTIPNAAEARSFLADTRADKRDQVIDDLLSRDGFASYASMKWCDLLRVKSEFPIDLWPQAVQGYHHWIRTSLQANKPYDRLVRELLTASGSNFNDPQVNFYRAVQSKDPRTLAQAVALSFMGARVDQWPGSRWADMAQFFSLVGYKATAEWKEEVVYYDFAKASNAWLRATFPDGKAALIAPGHDPRVVFADWLLDPENRWFARNLVNRVWYWLMGTGIYPDPDDICPEAAPGNPALLAVLEREFVANHYDLRQLYRLILRSQTYQLSCLPRTADARAEVNFAYRPVRRLEAEVLIDAVNQLTGTTESYYSPIPEPFTYLPEEVHAVDLADASISSSFLDLFGRSPRDNGLESERNSRPTAAQSLHLLNSSHIQRKLEQSAPLRSMMQSNQQKPQEVANELYLTVLTRYPTSDESAAMAAYRQANAHNGRRVGLDLAWALINSTEFQCRH